VTADDVKQADEKVRAAKGNYERACAERRELIERAIVDRHFTASEIARILGVSRARVGQLR